MRNGPCLRNGEEWYLAKHSVFFFHSVRLRPKHLRNGRGSRGPVVTNEREPWLSPGPPRAVVEEKVAHPKNLELLSFVLVPRAQKILLIAGKTLSA